MQTLLEGVKMGQNQIVKSLERIHMGQSFELPVFPPPYHCDFLPLRFERSFDLATDR